MHFPGFQEIFSNTSAVQRTFSCTKQWKTIFYSPVLLPPFSLLRDFSFQNTSEQQGRLLSAQARKSVQIFFVLGIFEEHAVFGEVEFDNLNFKRKAFINTLSTCQVEHFAIKRNSIWRQISLFDIACGNFAADEDLFM